MMEMKDDDRDLVNVLRTAADIMEKERKLYQPMANLVNWIIQPDIPIGSDAEFAVEFVRRVKEKAETILTEAEKCHDY